MHAEAPIAAAARKTCAYGVKLCVFLRYRPASWRISRSTAT